MTRSSTLQFPDSHILNHRIIVASFVCKGSHTGQAIRNDGFFLSISELGFCIFLLFLSNNHKKMKFKLEYYWFLIFALCFTAFNQIQDNIRPNYSGDNSIVKYLLGVAPNFFPAIGIPALFILTIPYVFKKKNSDIWFFKKRHLSSNLISVIGLVVWEFAQMSGKLRFDWNDILWTFIGALLFQIIWILSPQKYKEI